MQQKKRFIIDTSVILDSPYHMVSLYQNGENELYISDIILKELNKHKEDGYNEKGFFAREFIRALDNGTLQTEKIEKTSRKGTRKKKAKKITKLTSNKLIPKMNDSIHAFKCIFEGEKNPIVINIINRERYRENNAINDMKIVEIAKDYDLDLITNDIALKIIALSKNINAESLKKGRVDNPEHIDFRKIYYFNQKNKDKIKNKIIETEKPWTQIIMKEKEVSYETGRQEFYIRKNGSLVPVEEDRFHNLRVRPLNVEQKFYATMLQENFEIMVVTGSTGSGKTLLALQEGIRRVSDPKDPIDGIVYMRNTVTASDSQAELGFRKGDESTKLGYFAYPLFGAINFIVENSFKKNNKEDLREKTEIKRNSTTKEDHTQKFMKDYNIEVMDIAHARGVTISNKFVIFDELQNSSNETLKLIGTRIGKGSKLVLMGDFRQVDHPYLTKNRNALVTMLKVAEKDDMVAAIQLRNTIRSDIANWFQESI
jgi:PhoH-like ATPase